MTIKEDVTTSPTVMRAFTGRLEVGDETVPAAVHFADGSVSLIVADDEVGNWADRDVDFVPTDLAYDIRAEGDSIRFVPDQSAEFATFLRDPHQPVEDFPPPAEADTEPDEPGRRIPDVSPPHGPASLPEGEGSGFDSTDTSRLLGADLAGPTESLGDAEAPAGLLSEDQEDTSEDVDQPSLAVEPPDEYYAAGLFGPSSDLPRPTFRSGLTQPDAPTPESPSGGAVDEEVEDTSLEQEVIPTEPPDRLTRTEPAPTEEPEPTQRGPEPEIRYETPTSGVVEPDSEMEEGQGEETSSPLWSLSGMLSRLRTRTTSSQKAEDAAEDPHEVGDGDLPTPIDDSDSLKQWALVAAGGVVLMAIVAVVAWGLVSILGGEDPEVAAAGSDASPTTAIGPAPSAAPSDPNPPSTAPTLTTVPPENLAAAEAFVASWNALARDYAYHLTISADSLPISTAPAPTVHLTYGEDGTLELTMAPRGTGSDRDILVAMGLAVAWADPGLAPEGRKQLLGSMGVDVDQPQVGNMGGELQRNGVSYSTAVTDGIIRFRVIPAS